MIEKMILLSREEWLKHRMQGIGGSEISAVVGLNPYMSNVDLWELKTGAMEPEDISDKPYIKYGTQAAPFPPYFSLFRTWLSEYFYASFTLIFAISVSMDVILRFKLSFSSRNSAFSFLISRSIPRQAAFSSFRRCLSRITARCASICRLLRESFKTPINNRLPPIEHPDSRIAPTMYSMSFTSCVCFDFQTYTSKK